MTVDFTQPHADMTWWMGQEVSHALTHRHGWFWYLLRSENQIINHPKFRQIYQCNLENTEYKKHLKGDERTWDSRDWVKGSAAEAKDLVLSPSSSSEPITSFGLMMSQSSITGPEARQKQMRLTTLILCQVNITVRFTFFMAWFALKLNCCSYCPQKASHPSWAAGTAWLHS